MRQATAGMLGLLLATVLTGCGERTIPVVPVSGKVLFQGQPAPGAQVVLHPVTADPSKVFAATGKALEDGTFKIGVNVAGDGAPPGDYVATVQWFKVVQSEGGSGPGPNVIPKDYGDPARSPLKVTVKDGPTELEPFQLR
jgi:hypothetical protein